MGILNTVGVVNREVIVQLMLNGSNGIIIIHVGS